MKKIVFLFIFLIYSNSLFADDTVNGITLPALKNYADRFIYLEKIRQKICLFYTENPEESIFINELPILQEENKNLASIGFEFLPLTPKQVFERNILILGKGNIININFFGELESHADIIQNNEMEIIEPYQGASKKLIFDYSKCQLSITKQIIADYLVKKNAEDYALQQKIPDFSKKHLSDTLPKEIEFEDLRITLLGFSLGGPLANLMALNLNHYHPTMIDNSNIKIITFGSLLAFDTDLARFYNSIFKNVSLNLIHTNGLETNFGQDDDPLKHIGTYVLTPDPHRHRYTLQGYRQSLGMMSNDKYRVFVP